MKNFYHFRPFFRGKFYLHQDSFDSVDLIKTNKFSDEVDSILKEEESTEEKKETLQDMINTCDKRINNLRSEKSTRIYQRQKVKGILAKAFLDSNMIPNTLDDIQHVLGFNTIKTELKQATIPSSDIQSLTRNLSFMNEIQRLVLSKNSNTINGLASAPSPAERIAAIQKEKNEAIRQLNALK